MQRLGGLVLAVCRELGGICLVFGRTLRLLVPPRLDGAELLRAMVRFGEASLPICAATAAFTGMIMVLQAALYVDRYGAYDFVGWYVGFATFREVGPVLIGLMFSGRVGANNTSELATMRVNEQIDALRVLALDVYALLVAPRTICMVIALGALVVFGDVVAIGGGALSAKVLLGVSPGTFWDSLVVHLTPWDFLEGLAKALVFGLLIGVVSSHFGLSARGGSVGVGRAVHAQVVACALGIFVADYFVTVGVL